MKRICRLSQIAVLGACLSFTCEGLGKSPVGNPTGGTSNNLLQQGEAFFNKRSVKIQDMKNFVVDSKNIDQAISVFRKILTSNSGASREREQAGVFFLMSLHFKAEYTGASEDVQKALYDEGKAIGTKLSQQYPKSAALKYWLAVQWGKWAKVFGKIAAARQGAAEIIRDLSQDLIKLDPNYYFAGGYRVLGRLHHQSPYIPLVLSWPDNKKAVENLELAVKRGPYNILNNLFLGEALMSSGGKSNRKRALNLLEKAAKIQPNKSRHVEDLKDLAEVKRVLKLNR